MKYILAQPAVGAVIPGASKLEQLRENVKAASARPLTEQEIKALRFYTKRDVYTAHRE